MEYFQLLNSSNSVENQCCLFDYLLAWACAVAVGCDTDVKAFERLVAAHSLEVVVVYAFNLLVTSISNMAFTCHKKEQCAQSVNMLKVDGISRAEEYILFIQIFTLQ